MDAQGGFAGDRGGGVADHVVHPAERERGLVAFVEGAGSQLAPGPAVLGQGAGEDGQRAEGSGVVVQICRLVRGPADQPDVDVVVVVQARGPPVLAVPAASAADGRRCRRSRRRRPDPSGAAGQRVAAGSAGGGWAIRPADGRDRVEVMRGVLLDVGSNEVERLRSATTHSVPREISVARSRRPQCLRGRLPVKIYALSDLKPAYGGEVCAMRGPPPRGPRVGSVLT